MDTIEREYAYHHNRKALLGWGLFCALGAAVFAYQAATNERALTINGIPIGFTAAHATIFYWAVCAGSGALVGLCVYLAKQWQRIALGRDALYVPASRWSNAEREILYRSINGMRLGVRRSFTSQVAEICIYHKSGIDRISAAMFASDAAFGEFCQLLDVKFKESRPPDFI